MSVRVRSRDVSTTLVPDRGRMRWNGWSAPSEATTDTAAGLARLEEALGPLTPAPSVALVDVRLPASRLHRRDLDRLRQVVGQRWLRDDHASRVEHAAGRSYPDLIRLRRGEVAAPDAVALPGDAAEIAGLLAVCADEGIAVVPFGGGTSVVGGVEPRRGGLRAVVALDLRRLDRLLQLDELAGIARFQPGIRGADAERRLRERGFTMGHFPQSYEHATLGGYVATRSAGQASSGYGRIDDLVVGARLVTPTGELRVGHGARTATGPDLRSVVVGSEGTLGVITEVTLAVRPAPAVERYEAWVAPSFAAGAAAVRALATDRVAGADVVRLSDEPETRLALDQAVEAGRAGAGAMRRYLDVRGIGSRPSLLVLGWDGEVADLRRRRAAVRRLLRRRRGFVWLGPPAGWAWARHRFDGPYQRDELLDLGVAVDTLETAGSWSQLGGLYLGVRGAIGDALRTRGTPGLVLCHVSHVYRTGASLYLTWLARREPRDELGQWEAVKRAASEAILAAGGTITHHHAVGSDHRPWMAAEVGEVGLDALRAVKQRLDPAGIMNPEKLLP